MAEIAAAPARPPQKAKPEKSAIKVIDGKEEYDREVVKSSVPVVFEVSAKWCPPCKEQQAILEGLAKELSPGVKFVQMDFDKNRSFVLGLLKDRTQKQIPYLEIYNQGQKVKRFFEKTPAEKIKEELQKLREEKPSARAALPRPNQPRN